MVAAVAEMEQVAERVTSTKRKSLRDAAWPHAVRCLRRRRERDDV
jgi:hypothetical protein